MKEKSIKILWAIIGVLLIAFGVAFNAAIMLGNDPIGILYDGVRDFANLSEAQFGTAVYIVNIAVAVIVFIFGRQYINIGTFIYMIPYGFFVDLGTNIYARFLHTDVFLLRCLVLVLGCILLYIGVAMFITVKIGLDPFTGLVMVIKDRLQWSFGKTKITFDFVLIIIGYLLGGTLGLITVITAFVGGPCIDFIQKRINKIMKIE